MTILLISNVSVTTEYATFTYDEEERLSSFQVEQGEQWAFAQETAGCFVTLK